MSFFRETWQSISSVMMQFTVRDLIDIILVAFLVYSLIKLTAKTRAFQVLKGLGILLVASQITRWVGLSAVTWLFDYVINNLAIVLVIIFQPEFRRMLEQIGQGKFFLGGFNTQYRQTRADYIRGVNEIIHAVYNMSQSHTGALIVIQRQSNLNDIAESGVAIDGQVSRALLENIFVQNTPLHDGAVIIRDNVIVAAGCLLPNTSSREISQDMGTRHRAAMGISEVTDAFVIVVSEETGIVSMVEEGSMTRRLSADTLRLRLMEFYVPPEKKDSFANLFRRKEGQNK
ncbi:MAG: diadenylate cyclase CdaA [Christensenellales bacterium]